ncbi:MAG: hypothetical protein IKH34_09245 [Oscillospiraceae bacterium]|nr:hypothetical protein [Oscillospiraceae bacterium]
MKTKLAKTSDKLLVLLFCLCLGGMLALFLLLPKEEVSLKEKRVLAAPPRLTAAELLSGRFAADAERFTADHLPVRDFLVGLDARAALLLGRQTAGEVYLCRDGRLAEAPAAYDEDRIRRNMDAILDFAAAAPCPVDLLLVPSAGAAAEEGLPALADPYRDGEIIAAAYQMAEGQLRTLELLPLFRAAEDPAALYYRTDHHWTSRGAQLAASAYLASIGCEAGSPEDYEVRREPDFRGNTYARAALWDIPAEELELWDDGGRYLVENAETPGLHQGLFYEERLAENDKYPVFLDGNHSLVRVRNQEGAGKGRLLLIRDSFGSSFACFLAEDFEELVLVDLRYYREPVSELLAAEDFDRVLILYSVGNFMSDSNIVKLD